MVQSHEAYGFAALAFRCGRACATLLSLLAARVALAALGAPPFVRRCLDGALRLLSRMFTGVRPRLGRVAAGATFSTAFGERPLPRLALGAAVFAGLAAPFFGRRPLRAGGDGTDSVVDAARPFDLRPRCGCLALDLLLALCALLFLFLAALPPRDGRRRTCGGLWLSAELALDALPALLARRRFVFCLGRLRVGDRARAGLAASAEGEEREDGEIYGTNHDGEFRLRFDGVDSESTTILRAARDGLRDDFLSLLPELAARDGLRDGLLSLLPEVAVPRRARRD